MKKYQNPQIKIILVEDNDLICTSDPIFPEGQVIDNGTNGEADARVRRNTIWDDFE